MLPRIPEAAGGAAQHRESPRTFECVDAKRASRSASNTMTRNSANTGGTEVGPAGHHLTSSRSGARLSRSAPLSQVWKTAYCKIGITWHRFSCLRVVISGWDDVSKRTIGPSVENSLWQNRKWGVPGAATSDGNAPTAHHAPLPIGSRREGKRALFT